jgi:hypothetical protein
LRESKNFVLRESEKITPLSAQIYNIQQENDNGMAEETKTEVNDN